MRRCFAFQKFRAKTGREWETAAAAAACGRRVAPLHGKYEMLQLEGAAAVAERGAAQWEYYVDDGVDGKRTGWYGYTAEGSATTEELYHTHARNAHMTQRFVASGHFTYEVDLTASTQTNTRTGTRRQIRRVC